MARNGKKPSFLRGRRIRVTRLDRNGRPVFGDESQVVTKGFVTAGYTTNMEEGEAISQTNASGENCVQETPVPTFNGFAVEIEFCEVDFALFSLITGQDLVLDPETGQPIGITESTAVDLSAVNFALEMWLGAQTEDAPHANGQGHFGYIVTPFLGGGVIGDVSVENGAITFTISGMQTKNGTAWGRGPYRVMLGADGTPDFLSTPMRSSDHRRMFYTEVAPPEPTAGTRPLLEPGADGITGLDVDVQGNEVTLTPTPASDDPAWYDLGDGQWDFSETGTYTHTYDGPGSYTVVANRGGTSHRTTVTVSA